MIRPITGRLLPLSNICSTLGIGSPEQVRATDSHFALQRGAFPDQYYVSKQFKPNIYYSPNLQEISDHQHYPPLRLDKCVWVVHYDSIDLG